jgi:hypothetical protein
MRQSMVAVVSVLFSDAEDSGGQPIRTSTLSHGMSTCQWHRICSIGHFAGSVFLGAPRDCARNSPKGGLEAGTKVARRNFRPKLLFFFPFS